MTQKMSRKYEGLIALTTKSQEGSMDDLVNEISKEIESAGAKVENVNNMGRRDFAYTPRKIAGAHYVTYTIFSEPAAIAVIKEKLSSKDAVYLNQFNRVA